MRPNCISWFHGLVKEPRYADLAAHIDKIRKHLNRTNRPAGKEKTSSSKKKSG
jgi:hypothetical protein